MCSNEPVELSLRFLGNPGRPGSDVRDCFLVLKNLVSGVYQLFHAQLDSGSKSFRHVTMINPLGWKTGSALSFMILVTAFLYKRHADEILQDRLNQILSGLLRAEKKVSLRVQKRVALGFGGCEDVFAGAIELVGRLNLTAPQTPRHYLSVQTGQQVAELLTFFFQHGAAAE